MIARPHDRPPRPTLALLPGEERPSRIDPAKLDDWTGGWIAQLAAPSAELMGAGAEQIVWDVSTGSQARTMPSPDGGWTVVQRGPVRLCPPTGDLDRLSEDLDHPSARHRGPAN
jgi:hypothetical protein